MKQDRAPQTEEKSVEGALRKSEERFHQVVESAPNAMVMVNAAGRIEMVNAQTERLFGYARGELLGHSIEMLVPERFRGHHPALRNSYFTEPTSRPMGAGRDLFGLRKDHTEFPIEIGLNPIETEEGTMVVSSIVDLSARKRMEERFRQVVEAAPNAMVMINGGGEIVMMNAQAERVFGYARDEVLGRPVEMLVPERFRRSHPGLRTSFFHEPQSRPMGAGRDLYGLRKDGSEVPVEIGLNPIETEEGIMVLSAIVDISDRKQKEERDAIEGQLRQAQKMEAIGNLAGGIAHDFNNLLAVIIGNLDLAKPLVGPKGDTAELVNESLEAALRGAELTQRLLAFARRQPLNPARLSLNELVTGMVRLLERTLGENVTIAIDLTADPWAVDVDAAQLESAIVNLATNARDAMPKGGTLMIATRNRHLDADYVAAYPELMSGDYALVEVSDTGTGMTADVMEQIFEPFFTTKELGKGTGLGLSMVFGFLKQSGGHITVYSEVDLGTTFRMYLPRAVTAAKEAAETLTESAVGAGETILAVEDNEGLRRVVIRQLRKLGYRVLQAESAAAALTVLEQENVDLVFTDVVMPGEIDGFALARLVLRKYPAIKVVLTSGFPDTKMNGTLNALTPSVRLLSKPYRTDELARLLREALDA